MSSTKSRKLCQRHDMIKNIIWTIATAAILVYGGVAMFIIVTRADPTAETNIMSIGQAYALGVPINPYWGIVVEDHGTDKFGDGEVKILKLSWGWTAGMSEKDLENYADDAPKGYDYVLIRADAARDLIADLMGHLGGESK